MKDNFYNELFSRINAGFPGIYIQSFEEQRVFSELLKVCDAIHYNLFSYSCAKGLEQLAEVFKGADGTQGLKLPDKKSFLPETEGPLEVLKVISDNKTVPRGSLVNLRLFNSFLEDPGIQTYILDILHDFKNTERQLLITSPTVKLPIELEKYFAVVNCELPSKEILEECLDGIVENNDADGKLKKLLKPEVKTKMLEAAAGLTLPEAENVFGLALVKSKKNNFAEIIYSEKSQVIKKTGILEMMETDPEGMKHVGGLDNLKEWIKRRKKAFTQKAKEYGLPKPRGLMLVGPPGSGKSLMCKAISVELDIPLVRFDVGKVFGSLVGDSERNMRNALSTAEAMAPCVLMIDEIEKAFGGAGGNTELDSGVSTRVFGNFLSWMNDCTKPVFVVATANNVKALPPELLRKGRFDEIFSVMLPNKDERKAILSLHLDKRGRSHLIGENPKINLDYFVEKTEGFSGSELEAAIVEAMHISFDDDKELNFIDLEKAIDETKPLSVTMGEQIAMIKEWCHDRTRSANAEENVDVVKEVQSSAQTAMSVAQSLMGGGRKIKTNTGSN